MMESLSQGTEVLWASPLLGRGQSGHHDGPPRYTPAVYILLRLYRFSSDAQLVCVANPRLEKIMTEQTAQKTPKTPKPAGEKPTPIGRLTLPEVDSALAECDKTIKTHSETVKAKLTSNASIPPAALRELSRANGQRARLTMRRIVLLLESGDSAVVDLIEKLVKVKPARSA
jgi:hypothetical protein